MRCWRVPKFWIQAGALQALVDADQEVDGPHHLRAGLPWRCQALRIGAARDAVDEVLEPHPFLNQVFTALICPSVPLDRTLSLALISPLIAASNRPLKTRVALRLRKG